MLVLVLRFCVICVRRTFAVADLLAQSLAAAAAEFSNTTKPGAAQHVKGVQNNPRLKRQFTEDHRAHAIASMSCITTSDDDIKLTMVIGSTYGSTDPSTKSFLLKK